MSNKIERFKAEVPPAQFIRFADDLKWDALGEFERFQLKNYGIYNIKLRPDRFMIRLRIDGGALPLAHWRHILDIAKRYKVEMIVTARAQPELHGFSADTIYEAFRELQSFGISSMQTLTDNIRAIVTDPYEGLKVGVRGDTYDLIEKMRAVFLNRSEWIGMLPRKFNTAILSREETHLGFFANDLFFAPAYKEGVAGYNLYIGGKNSEAAQPLDLFCLPQDVTKLFEATIRYYLQNGLRGSRSKCRLYHLIQAKGMEEIRRGIVSSLDTEVYRSGETVIRKKEPRAFERIGDTEVYRIPTHYGKTDIATLDELVSLIRTYGGKLRIGIDQALYVIGNAAAAYRRIDKGEPSIQAHITVCAGSRYCALSLWDMKEQTRYLPLQRLAELKVRVGMSGCLKGCGRHHHVDIGIVGLRTNAYGNTRKAARIYLAGGYIRHAHAAVMIYPSVPLEHLHRLVDAILDEFEASDYEDFEDFSLHMLSKFSQAFLAMWFAAKIYLEDKQTIRLEIADEPSMVRYLRDRGGLDMLDNDDGYVKTIRFLTHALWDD